VDDLRTRDPAEIAADVIADPPLIATLLDAMLGDDEDIQARAAAAAEQAARERPELLAPHADALIEAARIARTDETRRNVAQMLARVELSDERATEATEVLERYLDGASPAVGAWTLSAIVALANEHAGLRTHARELVHRGAENEAPPVRERARLLLDQADSWPSGAGTS
jgi:hypothetical protein